MKPSSYSDKTSAEVHELLYEKLITGIPPWKERFDQIVEERGHKQDYRSIMNFSCLNAPSAQLMLEILNEASRRAEEEDTHPGDCTCGQCTGEDASIEAMERGIVEAENARIGDD